MGVLRLPDDLKQLIERHVAEGHAASEADFLAEAIARHAQALELNEAEAITAAQDGLADIEAGRYDTISRPDDLRRLQAELRADRDRSADIT